MLHVMDIFSSARRWILSSLLISVHEIRWYLSQDGHFVDCEDSIHFIRQAAQISDEHEIFIGHITLRIQR